MGSLSFPKGLSLSSSILRRESGRALKKKSNVLASSPLPKLSNIKLVGSREDSPPEGLELGGAGNSDVYVSYMYYSIGADLTLVPHPQMQPPFRGTTRYYCTVCHHTAFSDGHRGLESPFVAPATTTTTTTYKGLRSSIAFL